jgi:hypothetical protein
MGSVPVRIEGISGLLFEQQRGLGILSGENIFPVRLFTPLTL